jgi:diguanylate cyclase (GGDEF)-like protein
VAPEVLDPISFVVSAYLAWRLFAILNERDNSDGDLLTGFMEPRAFERHLGGVIQQSSDERPALLIAVDLDGFGAWNARNGYSAGDEMLASVAAMLESESPNGAVWGRLKGDRFALTTKSLGIMADRELAEHLQAVAVQGAAPLSARAAIIQLPQDAQRTAEALDAADETLRAGSAGGRSVVAYSSGGMDGLSPVPGYASLGTRREKIQALIASTESIQIVLQPIVHIDALTICGFEALSRFHTDPRHGPDEWISEATLLGLGIDLEIECARRAWRRRNDIGGAAHIAINLSPEAILSEMLSDAIDSEDLEGLVVEITEHERVLNYPRLAARLASLRGRGAKIAVDDMGAGHASLSHLIELKPDFIKLDRKLVTGLDLEPGKHALVRNMLRLSSDLGAQLIAEGIETMGELTALRELGVPLGQGYFLGRPTEETEEHFERLAAASSLRSASSPVA